MRVLVSIAFCFLYLSFVLGFVSEGYTQNVSWANQLSGDAIKSATKAAVSSRGVNYGFGQYNGTLSSQNNSITSSGTNSDLFLVKFNRAGSFQLLQSIGGPEVETPGSMVIDNIENPYLCFSFKGTIALGTNNLTALGTSEDVLVTRMNFFGAYLWSRKIGGPGEDKAKAIGIDGNGNVYVALNFNRYLLNGTDTLKSRGDFDIAIAKYNPIGTLIWIKSFGGITRDNVNEMVVDAAGNIVVTGFSTGRAFYDSTYSLPGFGFQDAFVARYNTNGELIWVKRWGGPMGDEAFTIAQSRDGHLYVGGTFQTTARFDSSITLVSNGFSDVFLAKLDTLGRLSWVKTIGNGSATESISQIVVSPINQLHFIGSYPLTIYYQTFGITSAGRSDIMVGRMDTSGNMLALTSFGGPEADFGKSIAVDGARNSVFWGSFQDTCRFGSQLFRASLGSGTPPQDLVLGMIDSIRPNLQGVMSQSYLSALNIVVYPNPAIDEIKIKADGDMEKLGLFDLTGREVKVNIINNLDTTTVSWEGTKSGLYYFRGSINGSYFTVPIAITTSDH